EGPPPPGRATRRGRSAGRSLPTRPTPGRSCAARSRASAVGWFRADRSRSVLSSKMVLECVEARVPVAALTRQPGLGLAEPVGVQAVDAALAAALEARDPRLPQHAQMARDSRAADGK